MSIFQERYSVRKYDDRPVEREKLEEIIRCAHLAPSACNSQPWRYVVVDDKEKLEQVFNKGLGVLVPNNWAKKSPCIIAACALKNALVHNVAGTFKGIDYCMLDMGASIENILLKAADLGLGTCWIGWFGEKAIKKILNIPRNIKIVSLITVGYPHNDFEKPSRNRISFEKVLFFNEFES